MASLRGTRNQLAVLGVEIEWASSAPRVLQSHWRNASKRFYAGVNSQWTVVIFERWTTTSNQVSRRHGPSCFALSTRWFLFLIQGGIHNCSEHIQSCLDQVENLGVCQSSSYRVEQVCEAWHAACPYLRRGELMCLTCLSPPFVPSPLDLFLSFFPSFFLSSSFLFLGSYWNSRGILSKEMLVSYIVRLLE